MVRCAFQFMKVVAQEQVGTEMRPRQQRDVRFAEHTWTHGHKSTKASVAAGIDTPRGRGLLLPYCLWKNSPVGPENQPALR